MKGRISVYSPIRTLRHFFLHTRNASKQESSKVRLIRLNAIGRWPRPPFGSAESRPVELRVPLYSTEPALTGVVHLPELDQEDKEQLVESFVNFVARANIKNTNQTYWRYTWLAKRDQHNNSLLANLHFLRRIIVFASTEQPVQVLSVRIDDPWVANSAAEIFRHHHWNVICSPVDRLAWLLRKMRISAKPLLDAIRIFSHGWRLWAAGRKFPYRPVSPENVSVIISTIFHDSLTRCEQYNDTYFGSLPRWLNNHGEVCLMLGQPQGAIEPITQTAAAFRDVLCETTGHMLALQDIPAIAWQALWTRFRLPEGLNDVPGAAKLAAASLSNRVIDVGLGLIVERATKAALDASPKARVIRMCENNPWEHAVDSAARDRSDPRHVTGYFHCAVLPAHLKNIADPNDPLFLAGPDMVVCTGTAAREILLAQGPRDPRFVLAGCNLRGADLLSLPAGGDPRPIRTVLVLLEGLKKMAGILRFSHDVAQAMPHLLFVVRPHPAMPLEKLAELADVEIGPDSVLQKSEVPGLSSDLERSDCVMYQGSTAALSGAFMGKFLLNFDGNSLRQDDPLFACDSLKAIVRRPADVVDAIARFERMSADDYREEADKLQKYIIQYISPQNDASLLNFLTGEYSNCGSEN